MSRLTRRHASMEGAADNRQVFMGAVRQAKQQATDTHQTERARRKGCD